MVYCLNITPKLGPGYFSGPQSHFELMVKDGEVYASETFCMKRTSVHSRICAQNLNCSEVARFEILRRLFGCENISGPSRNGPQDVVLVTHCKLELIWTCWIVFQSFLMILSKWNYLLNKSDWSIYLGIRGALKRLLPRFSSRWIFDCKMYQFKCFDTVFLY